MKARFLALAALVLGLAACQTEPEGLDVNVGGAVDTTITVSLPETTRANSALGAFDNVDLTGDATIRYILQIFDQNNRPSDAEYVKYSDGKSVVFPVRLVPGRNYRFVVWADYVESETAGDKHYNTRNSEGKIDLTNITLNDTWVAMDETRDAFTATELVENYSGTSSINITLTRPFAKLRVITTDMKELGDLDIEPHNAVVSYTTQFHESFNAFNGQYGDETVSKTHISFIIKEYDDNVDNKSKVLFTDYFFADDSDVVKFVMNVNEANGALIKSNTFNTDIAVRRNYLTTISGNILTDGNNVKVDVQDAFEGYINNDVDKDEVSTTVNTAQDLVNALTSDDVDVIVLNGDIDLNDLLTRAADPTTLTVAKTLTIDLNGKTLSATSAQTGKNYDMFFVTNSGDLTVKNGNIVYEHSGENMGWNNCTDIFRVSFNGKLTLESVTAENKGGSDMAYVVDMSNASKLSVNIDNSTLKSTYIPVRVFNNSGMHNVTIKNTTLEGKYCFWVQYWLADGRDQATLDETLNISIYHNDNTFTYAEGRSAVIYGFNETIYADEYGITKTVSEDGTVVTLGSMTDNGIVRRGVAGTESNDVIKKVVLGDGIAELPNRTFYRYYALETVELPNTLTVLGANGSHSTSGNIFQGCKSLKNIVIPESVTTMGPGVFYGCLALESINIPVGVTRIEENALRETGLVSVEFHEGVTYFGAQAFRDCKQLKEVIIKAPEFTIEANSFGSMAAPYPAVTIYVANAEMKAYLESTLAYASQFEVVAPNSVASKEDLPVENGKLDTNFDEDVNLYGDITVSANETNANSGYGATGVTVTNGAVLNGQGHTLTVNNAWDTWDCVVAAKGGTIKNLTVSSAMRGIFMPGANGDVYIDNVIFDNVIYTFNSDAGDKNYGVYISNSTLNGWTSHSDVHKEVIYTNCKFGKGNGYAYCRPYGKTEFVGCAFEAGFEVDAIGKITFENCTIDGVALTAENLATLVTSGIANASVK